jgi:hypothetical protein
MQAVRETRSAVRARDESQENVAMEDNYERRCVRHVRALVDAHQPRTHLLPDGERQSRARREAGFVDIPHAPSADIDVSDPKHPVTSGPTHDDPWSLDEPVGDGR